MTSHWTGNKALLDVMMNQYKENIYIRAQWVKWEKKKMKARDPF